MTDYYFGKARQLLNSMTVASWGEVSMTLNPGIALLTHAHPKLLLRGPEFDARGVLRAAITRLHQAICGLGGHDDYVRTAGHRMFLECVRCGRATRGWRIYGKTQPDRITRHGETAANRTLREVQRGPRVPR